MTSRPEVRPYIEGLRESEWTGALQNYLGKRSREPMPKSETAKTENSVTRLQGSLRASFRISLFLKKGNFRYRSPFLFSERGLGELPQRCSSTGKGAIECFELGLTLEKQVAPR